MFLKLKKTTPLTQQKQGHLDRNRVIYKFKTNRIIVGP